MAAPLMVAAGMLALALALVLWAPPAKAQMGDPFSDWTPDGVGAVKTDIPYIKCGVCQRVAETLIARLDEKKKRATKAKPVRELDIIELTEKICDRKTIDGGWVLRTDMEEDGDRIKLVEYDFDGECGSECRTIQKACEEVMGDKDTEVAEFLETKGLTLKKLEHRLCHDLTDSCVNPPPPVPADRAPGEPFEKPKPKDYSKMAEDMGIKESVMHNTPDNYEIPEGLPQMPPPKHLQNPSKDKKKKKKKKKSKSSGFDSMSEL